MISAYLVDIIILLLAAVVAVPLCQLARLGAVPGFLIAGVVVGPYGLSLISNVEEMGNLAEIGVVLLLFVIGIELKPSRLRLMWRLVFGLGTLQVIVTGLLLGGLAYSVFDLPLKAAILIGPALALSSTAFVLQLLTEQKLLTSSYGRASIGVLLFQDLAVVPLLALLPLLAMPDLTIGKDIGFALLESLVILVLVVVVGRYFLHPILHRIALSGNPEVFTASAVLIVLGTALVTEHIGLSMAMGAFLAGLLIADSAYRHQVMSEIQPFRGFLLGLFFMSMGMALNLQLLLEYPLQSLGIVSGLMIIKAVLLYLLCYLFGLKGKNGLAVALVLAQSGEFGLVLFSLAFQSSLLDQMLFQQLLLYVLLSMLVTPLLASMSQHLVKSQNNDKDKVEDIVLEAPIVLAGFGRVGHRIGEILTQAGKPFIALDLDDNIVQRERARGHPVFYGDVRKPQVLKSAGASNAKIVIVTLNDPAAAEEVVVALHHQYPQIKIYVRGHSLEQCRELRRLGASGVVSENIEASLQMARMILMDVGVSEKECDTIVEDFRHSYQSRIDEALK